VPDGPPAALSPAEIPYSGNGGDRLLDAEEVAAMLSVPVRWVREHTRSGLIPHVRLGRYIRYRREAVMIWITEQEQGGAAWRTHRPVPAAGTK
jgi:excisionase family DNA binding protein